VVYVKHVLPGRPIITVKRERTIGIGDIVREDLRGIKLLVGIFMSPLDVHYNRAPISGKVTFVNHYPAVTRNYHMTSMHWRSLLKRFPIYENSPHLIHNERTVTRIEGEFKNEPISCYLIQIAGGSVRGIDSYVCEQRRIRKGAIFGMIRIGSQVDLVVTWRESMTVKVKPGDKVWAGETVCIN
jgi:phosphatidylserine decarboxylase